MDKLIILVRHGHYDYVSRDISERGTAQINELSTFLQRFCGEKIMIYCGSDKICLHTTEIIENNLGIKAQTTKFLSHQEQPNLEEMKELIENAESRIIIIITHLAQTVLFHSYLGNSSKTFDCPSIGGAILLQVTKKKTKSLVLPRESKKFNTFVKNLPSMPG